jgi:hypothetical protein
MHRFSPYCLDIADRNAELISGARNTDGPVAGNAPLFIAEPLLESGPGNRVTLALVFELMQGQVQLRHDVFARERAVARDTQFDVAQLAPLGPDWLRQRDRRGTSGLADLDSADSPRRHVVTLGEDQRVVGAGVDLYCLLTGELGAPFPWRKVPASGDRSHETFLYHRGIAAHQK